jgi:hypothetical protein
MRMVLRATELGSQHCDSDGHGETGTQREQADAEDIGGESEAGKPGVLRFHHSVDWFRSTQKLPEPEMLGEGVDHAAGAAAVAVEHGLAVAADLVHEVMAHEGGLEHDEVVVVAARVGLVLVLPV